MTITQFEEQFPNVRHEQFKNEYGEKFKVYYIETTILFGGDETDQEVIPLFNDKFNIWSQEELVKLSKAILLLAGTNI